MVPIDEARRIVLSSCPALAPVEVAVDDATGLVLAADVVAVEDVPPFPNSAVDGYAVQAADTIAAPVELTVVGEIAAGAAPDAQVGPGQAVRIMTGAPMPPGADAVVMVEDTELLGDRSVLDGSVAVRVRASVAPGDAVRGVGSDVVCGDTVLRAGTVATPPVVGVLASVNARTPLVHPRVRVAVLSTGDELVDDGSPLLPGQIRESNKVMLLGMVRDTGCEALDMGIIVDDEALLEAALRDAARRSDAIVTSGGVSMGDYDVVKAVLSRIADMQWMQIAIKPAKPFAFGLLDDGTGRRVPVFGLPGNPVSSMVSFELLARPALRQMSGHTTGLLRPSVRAIADAALRRRPDGKVHFQRVSAVIGDDGRVHVRSTGEQGSHQLAASALATALAVLPDGDSIEAGDEVEALLLDLPGSSA
jgi:molybdenum cofactor synthesis domain-containing protein